jgi:hypothetical protein
VSDSRVTIHMAASLDGFIARKDGSIDWLETSDEFADGATMDPAFIAVVPRDNRLLCDGLAHVRDGVEFRVEGLRMVVLAPNRPSS